MSSLPCDFSAVRADALFASALQRTDRPSPGQVRQAIAVAVAVPGDGHGDRLADLPGAGPVGALQSGREQRIGPDGAEVTRQG